MPQKQKGRANFLLLKFFLNTAETEDRAGETVESAAETGGGLVSEQTCQVSKKPQIS